MGFDASHRFALGLLLAALTLLFLAVKPCLVFEIDLALLIALLLIEHALLLVTQGLNSLGLVRIGWNGARRAVFDRALGLARDAGLLLRAIENRFAGAGGVSLVGGRRAVGLLGFAFGFVNDALSNAFEFDASFGGGRIENRPASGLPSFAFEFWLGLRRRVLRFGLLLLGLVLTLGERLTPRLGLGLNFPDAILVTRDS